MNEPEPTLTQQSLDDLIVGSARALTSIAPLLPQLQSVESVINELAPAVERGYFLPDEDEKVRQLFSSYLTTRAALQSVLEDLRPYAIAELKSPSPRQPEVFLISFCTACLLVRAGKFMVDSFRKNRVIWRKLDEAEPRFGIPAKQFTKVYRSLGSPQNIFTYFGGVNYYQENREQILALESNTTLRPIVEILKQEEPFIETSKRYFARTSLAYRWHSFLRRHHSGFKRFTFGLFKVSGSLIAELRMKWKRKRVTPGVQRKLSRLLEPGDVIITRHNDAASNLFLPGYWPHAALYVGTSDQRKSLNGDSNRLDPSLCRDPNCVLEARKDGVLFRPLNDTLLVDACVVLRPRLQPNEIRDAIACGMTHEGKGYDFEFDFRRSNKLVCTEVVYRSYHGIGNIQFELKQRAGRVCLSAEDLLDYAVADEFFDVVCVYGSDGNRFVVEDRAMNALIRSYRNIDDVGPGS